MARWEDRSQQLGAGKTLQTYFEPAATFGIHRNYSHGCSRLEPPFLEVVPFFQAAIFLRIPPPADKSSTTRNEAVKYRLDRSV